MAIGNAFQEDAYKGEYTRCHPNTVLLDGQHDARRIKTAIPQEAEEYYDLLKKYKENGRMD